MAAGLLIWQVVQGDASESTCSQSDRKQGYTFLERGHNPKFIVLENTNLNLLMYTSKLWLLCQRNVPQSSTCIQTSCVWGEKVIKVHVWGYGVSRCQPFYTLNGNMSFGPYNVSYSPSNWYMYCLVFITLAGTACSSCRIYRRLRTQMPCLFVHQQCALNRVPIL